MRIMQEIYLSFKKYIYLEGDFAIDVQTDIHRFLFYQKWSLGAFQILIDGRSHVASQLPVCSYFETVYFIIIATRE